MFKNCSALKILDISSFNTSNVTNMSGMFSGCSAITELDLSGFDTSKVTQMVSMFAGCSSLPDLDITSFSTSSVNNMEKMFMDCNSLTELDLSSFNTSKVTHMDYMFYNCSSLEELDISSFETGKVFDMSSMFYGCSKLEKLDLRHFDTGKVTQMPRMFYNCSALEELDVTSFEISEEYVNQSNVLLNCPAYSVTMEGTQLLLNKGLIGVQMIFTTDADLKTVVIDGPAGEKKIDVSELEINSEGKYIAPYYVDTTQSRRTITYSFYDKDGKKINLLDPQREIISLSEHSCTVNEIIKRYISFYGTYGIDDKTKTLAEELLNYCNAAENYFCKGNYTITKLSDKDIADINADHTTDINADTKISLVLDSATSFRVYTESKNVFFDGSTEKAVPKNKGGKQYYEIADIPAQQLLRRHTVTIDGTKYTFTPMSYVWRVINNPSLDEKLVGAAESAYRYAKAAWDYVQ